MSNKKLYRSSSDKRISGVCGGIAEYFNIDSTVVRLLVAAFTVMSFGTGVLLYFIAALIMPEKSEVRDAGVTTGVTTEVKKDSINPDDIV